ncbi:MAG: hypothetical protein PHI71_01415 [Acidiphilium sp.]|nr:hypothetical protein [Acidiphilium sp.]MEE3499955.1 hypothetical protein [Acidiphilium acidophilum]MEE3503694.1 hypothetical protein [Acidiphilium acidophilum]
MPDREEPKSPAPNGQLGPARGLLLAILLGLVFWALVAIALYIWLT